MAEQLAVNQWVVGSSPTSGAKKLDTNPLFFEDERVRLPSPAIGGASLALAALAL